MLNGLERDIVSGQINPRNNTREYFSQEHNPLESIYDAGSQNNRALNYQSFQRNETIDRQTIDVDTINTCLLYTSPSPRDQRGSRMPSSA